MKLYPVMIRVETLNTYQNIAGSSAHNLRLAGDLAHVDLSKTHLNKILVGTKDVSGAVKKLEKEYGQARKNGPLAFEMICTVNQEYFADKSPEDILRWADATIAFSQRKFGKNAVVQAFLHLDEESPHLHLTIVPLAETVRKNRFGEKRTIKINYSQVLGIPRGRYPPGTTAEEKRTGILQTEYAQAMAPFGLIRGVTRQEPDGGPVKNVSPRKYRESLAADLARLVTQQDEMEVPLGAERRLIVEESIFYETIAKNVALQTQELREANSALKNRLAATERLLEKTANILECPNPAQLPEFAADIQRTCSATPDIGSVKTIAKFGAAMRKELETREQEEKDAARKLLEEQSARPRRTKGQRKNKEERRAARAARRIEAERDSRLNQITHQITQMPREISYATESRTTHRAFRLGATHRVQETVSVPLQPGQ